jgi:hypothetical protein
MIDRNEGNCKAQEIERREWFDRPLCKGKKGEKGATVVQYLRSCIDRGHFLHAVELAEPDEMIIVSMCPYHRIDMGGVIQEHLKAQIRRTVDEEVFSLVLNKE